MNEITLNLQQFAEIIANNIKDKNLTDSFLLILTKYKESFGGCTCNRAKRQQYANEFFEKTLKNHDFSRFEYLKKLLNIEKIKFQNQKNEIFFEV